MPPKKKAAAKTPEEEAFETVLTMLKNRKAGSPPLAKPIDTMVMEFIEANPGIDINKMKKVGGSQETILKAAIANKETTTALINYLINKGVDITIPEAKYGSPLEVAIGNMFTNQKIFNKPKAEDNKFEILLMNGANGEQLDAGSALFSNGNKKNLLSVIKRLHSYDDEFPKRELQSDFDTRKKISPLMLFVQHGAPEEVIDFMLSKGADPNVEDEHGNDLLSALVDSYGSKMTVKKLEKFESLGFDLKRVDPKTGETLLHKIIKTIPLNASAKVVLEGYNVIKKLIDLGIDVNAKTKKGNTAFYQVLSRFYDPPAGTLFALLRLLLTAGYKIDEVEPDMNDYDSIKNASAFHRLCGLHMSGHESDKISMISHLLDFVTKNINHYASYKEYGHDMQCTPLWFLIRFQTMNPSEPNRAAFTDLIKKFKEKGANLNQETSGYTVLGYAKSLIQVNALMEAGIDVNAGTFPIYNWAHHVGGSEARYRDMAKALMANPKYNFSSLYKGHDLLYYLSDAVSRGKVSTGFFEMVKEVYKDNTGYKNTGKLWEGWTSTDAEKLDTVFDEEAASEVTLCPVCLKTTSREDGCMYIRGHNCANLEGYYHTELYEKYKSPEGIICWCTICNRIASGHRHYELGYSKSSKPDLLVGRDPFNKDCAATEGGGGLKEKFLRFRRLREHARDMMEDIGKVTEKQALDQLVEEMWNAPLQRKRGTNKLYEEKKFNFPASNFPAPARPATAAAAENKPINFNSLPNVPNQNSARPPTTLAGLNSIMQMAEDVVIQFHHTQPDGSVYNHEDKYISPDSLELFVTNQLKKYKTDEFGMCWAYPGDCKGRLHPEEIRPYVPEALYNEYKGKFNWKFGSRKGGTRKLRGGAPRNIFVPATDAQCYLPTTRRNNNSNTRNTRKNSRNNRV